jgi:hypothetical protein
MAFLVSFKRRFLQLVGLFAAMLLLMTPLAWLSVSHPQHVQNIGTIISQNAYLFLTFRWALILTSFIFWQSAISHVGIRRRWATGKIQFWQGQRLRVVIWLILFELVICENLLLTAFHLIEDILI